MRLLLKDARGFPSWSTTLTVVFFVLSVAIMALAVLGPDGWADRAAAILPSIVTCFVALVVGYCLRRGTEAKWPTPSEDPEE